MIFVTLGSQRFQFNRLLIEIDRLIELGLIKEEIFAQIGYSDYIPKNYRYKKFLNRDEFKNAIEISTKVITHGGTGAIIGALKEGKPVIAVPRVQEFNEHVDNHQIEITRQFKDMKLIESVNKIEDLYEKINSINNISIKKYVSNTSNIIKEIELFINSI